MSEDTPALTPAYCATQAGAALDRLSVDSRRGATAEDANALVNAAHAWMALGQLLDDRPAMRSSRD